MNRENLLAPNLIGSSEKHKNLKEWIIAKTRNDRTIMETVEKSVADSLADKINKAKDIPLNQIKGLRDIVINN